MRKGLLTAAAVAALLGTGSAASASVFITEFCSDTGNNEHFEFVEFTNLGSSAVSMVGWSEDDSHATPNVSGHSLSGFGALAPGESAIFTEATPADFRTYWGLPQSVKVIGPYTNDNLSTTADSITLFDSTGTLVDRLDYSTTNGGTADAVTRNAPLAVLGLNNNSLWQNSFIGDAYGSYSAPKKQSILGNPGTYAVPELASLTLLVPVGMLLATRRRRRT
jgi:Lamin Tail Domain